MYLSRPVNFPLLKLPWLCIKCVIHNTDLFAVIYFASISNRARRIVKSSNYPLEEIDITPSRNGNICMRDMKDRGKVRRTWYFFHDEQEFGEPLVLQRNSQPLLTSTFSVGRNHSLRSFTAGDDLNALKMGIDFLIDLFGCQIRKVFVEDKLSELLRLGINSVEELVISDEKPVNIAHLQDLLEKIRVTDKYAFFIEIPDDFYCDPQSFKCREIAFSGYNSAEWVTLEILCQFNVPQLTFWFHRFSVEDIVSYITYWFNSENRKLEYMQFQIIDPSLEDFEIERLNPMPFCEKRRSRSPLLKGWEKLDLSSGKDILRQDGLLSTLHAFSSFILFYVWHKRFPDDVQQ